MLSNTIGGVSFVTWENLSFQSKPFNQHCWPLYGFYSFICLCHIAFFYIYIYSLINRRGVIIPEPPESDKYGAVRSAATAPMVGSVDGKR